MSDVLERPGVPLAQLARPAGGRRERWAVLFTIVDRSAMIWGSAMLSNLLAEHVGPTRCGDVLVQPALDEDMAALYMASPVCRDVAAANLNAAMADFRAAPPGSVLLVAHCRVLWQQRRPSVWAT